VWTRCQWLSASAENRADLSPGIRNEGRSVHRKYASPQTQAAKAVTAPVGRLRSVPVLAEKENRNPQHEVSSAFRARIPRCPSQRQAVVSVHNSGDTNKHAYLIEHEMGKPIELTVQADTLMELIEWEGLSYGTSVKNSVDSTIGTSRRVNVGIRRRFRKSCAHRH